MVSKQQSSFTVIFVYKCGNWLKPDHQCYMCTYTNLDEPLADVLGHSYQQAMTVITCFIQHLKKMNATEWKREMLSYLRFSNLASKLECTQVHLLTVCRSSILVFTPMAISRLSTAVSGQGYSVARKLQWSKTSTIQHTKDQKEWWNL